MTQANLYDVIRNPHITEKTTTLNPDNQYVFKVAIDSDKKLIKKAISEVFNVKIKSVNTITIKGKTKKFKGRKGKRADYKKAIVTLEEGQTLDIATEV